MEKFVKLLGSLYWLGIVGLFVLASKAGNNYIEVFHKTIYYVPAVGTLLVISGQLDLLRKMREKNEINLKARIYDFVHWLMLTGMMIGTWMVKGSSIVWFILNLALLCIIAWQIGVGSKRLQKKPECANGAKKFGKIGEKIKNLGRVVLGVSTKPKETIVGMMWGLGAIILGGATGYIRQADQSVFGWGWGMESVTSIIATGIVMKWILCDLQTMSRKARGYPRSTILKGIVSNSLVFLFWVHIIMKGDFSKPAWWMQNMGLSFNVLIGNIIYLGYWVGYEYYRIRQKAI